MNPESVHPLSALKEDSAKIVARLKTSRGPIVLTQNGRAAAVLQDVESFRQQRDALLLLKLLAQGTAEIREGRSIPHAEASRRILRGIRRRRG